MMVRILSIGLGDACRVEIGAHLAEHIVVPCLFEVRAHHLLGIGVGILAGFAELFGGPQAEQLVAARHGLELRFLVHRKLLFEAFLTVSHAAHGLPRSGVSFRPSSDGQEERLVEADNGARGRC